jgi:hypothetical protein
MKLLNFVCCKLEVNRNDVDEIDEIDFQLLLQSDIGVVIVEENKLEVARQILTELKGETE